MTITAPEKQTVIIGDPRAPVRYIVIIHGELPVVRPEMPTTNSPMTPQPDPEEAMDVHAAARLLGLKPGTIEKRAARGTIPSFKDGWRRMYVRRDLLEYRAQLQAVTKTSAARNRDSKRLVVTAILSPSELKVVP